MSYSLPPTTVLTQRPMSCMACGIARFSCHFSMLHLPSTKMKGHDGDDIYLIDCPLLSSPIMVFEHHLVLSPLVPDAVPLFVWQTTNGGWCLMMKSWFMCMLRFQVSVQIPILLSFYSSQFILLKFYSCEHLQSVGVFCDCIFSQECDSVTSALFQRMRYKSAHIFIVSCSS